MHTCIHQQVIHVSKHIQAADKAVEGDRENRKKKGKREDGGGWELIQICVHDVNSIIDLKWYDHLHGVLQTAKHGFIVRT